MSGAVVSSGDQTLRGWALLPEQPTYPVTVHLVTKATILHSAMADGPCPEIARAGGDGLAQLPCWFQFDLAELGDIGPEPSLRLVVGETGECIYDADERTRSDASQNVAPARTYRDAFASGLTVADIMKVLYLDILRRPADVSGLAFHLSRWAAGHRSFELVRHALLASEEYGRRHKQLRDAAGNAFRRDVTFRSAEAVVAFEPLCAAFSESDLPLPARLICFFPGLLAEGDALEAAKRDVEMSLPEREVFFRALSRLADHPALVIEPRVLHASSADIADFERDPDEAKAATIDVPCPSPLFFSGWHQVEGAGTEACRWMKQIGVICNPQPQRPLQKIEVEVTLSYADTGALLAAGDSEPLAVTIQENGGQRRLACITSERGDFVSRRLVLVSAKATSPFRHDGSHDLRLLSIQASRARFVYAGSADP